MDRTSSSEQPRSANDRDNSAMCNSAWVYLGSGNLTAAWFAGEEIPLSARIVAIADVYDALRARRIYKPALPQADGLRMMVNEDAGHIDPSLLAAFQRCCGDFDRIFQQLTD